MKLRKALCILSVFIFVCSYSSTAQTGFPPFGSFQDGGFDSLNLQNLNATFMVPIVSHPGRGVAFQYALGYNSLVWTPTGSTPTWSLASNAGWMTTGPVGFLTFQRTKLDCPTTPDTVDTNFVFTDLAGTPHFYNALVYVSGPCQIQGTTKIYGTDASGFLLDAKAKIVYAPDGTKFTFTSTTSQDGNGNFIQALPAVTDANGNQITGLKNITTGETDWTDSLNQIVLKVASLFNNPNNLLSETDYSRLAVDGTYQVISAKYQVFNVKTNFGCTGVTEFTSGAAGVSLVTEIDFPNSKKYQFVYEPTPGAAGFVTARIQQVTLPTGGTIAYQYNGPNGGINCADGTVLNLTRTMNDGTNSATWDYSRGSVVGRAGTTTVTSPLLPYDQARNQTVVTFDSKGHETSRKIYQGTSSGSPVRTINTNWASNNTPATRFIVLEDGNTQSEVETAYDSNGNLQSSVEHDWGQGSPGAPLRTTTLTYLPGAAYAAVNIINRVQDKVVSDGSGTIKFRTHVDYDQAGFVNNTCVTGAVQHDDNNYGCSYTVRGLPTGVTTYTDAVTPSGGVTKNFSYDSLGNLVSAQLNCCQQKQWNFSAATQYAFADSVVSGSTGGPQLTTSATYYLTSGQLKTSTDENGQVTTYSYADPGHLDRLTDVQRPDLAHSTTAYDDVLMAVTTSSPVQGTNTVQNITVFDGLGRPLTKKIEDSSNTVYSIVTTQYDPLGRTYKSSNPYTVSPQFWTTNQFDALGRPTLTLLPDGAQGSSSYNLNSATVSDPAGKQRRSFSDGLGRMIEVDEPGDASAGAQANGSITINDPLNSKPNIPVSSGSGSFTIKGNEGAVVTCVGRPIPTCHTTYDLGSVQVTVNLPGNSITKTASYSQGATAQNLANSLAGQFAGTGFFTNPSIVNTTGADGIPAFTVTLTAIAVGSATNYSYSATQSGSHNDFTATTAGPVFTGGSDGQSSATDAGTITLKIGGFVSAPVCYGTTCNSTAAQVATALAQTLGAAGSPVHNVSVSGSTISMTANQFSALWNVPVIAAPSSSDPADFPNGSFSSQGSLQGGADPFSSGLAHPYVTSYQYGVLDNLLQVTQGVQTRSYGYDGIGRLTDVTTPEAGHVQLGYNSFDLITQRTDARGVVTNYSYDPLNRLKQIDYNVGSTGVPATPSVIYQYGSDSTQNNNGRIILITDGLGSEAYTYDPLGRVTRLQKVINGQTYAIGYAYNLAGEVTSMTYPSGRVVQQSFDAIGRLCEIAPQTTGCGTSSTPYANTYSYNAAFQTTGFVYGNGVTAGLNFSSDRLQLTNLNYSKGTQTLFGLNYFYKQDATNCPNGATGNNGQIECITDSVDSGRNVAYTYDTLGRLATAGTKGSTAYPQWGLAFTVDRYGNLTGQAATAGSTPPNMPPVNQATNQISTLPYDHNGNLLNDGNNTLVYDAENRTVSSTKSAATATYSYDCKSFRVQKTAGGVTTVYIFSGGKVIAEYENGALPGAPTREYIYAGSTILAKIEAGATSYYHPDHLSNRVITDSNGSVVGQQGHFPFGQNWYDSNTTKLKFTTYEHDSESGNDYAMARYYAGSLGRFTSTDPVAGFASNPQSLNRYAYVINDPVNHTDPTGQFLTALTLFLDRAGFPNAWANMNEFAMMEIPVHIGTAYLWHSGSSNFPFESYNHNDLAGFGAQGEISLLGTYPILGFAILEPPAASNRGADILQELAKKLAKQKLDKKKCKDDLAALGTSAAAVQAGANAANIQNGVGSAVPLSTLYPPAAAPHVSGTVGDKLAKPGVLAVASLVNNDIFVNPSMIKASDYYFNLGTDLHEVLHNITGLSDDQMQSKLGLTVGAPSVNITNKLISDCF